MQYHFTSALQVLSSSAPETGPDVQSLKRNVPDFIIRPAGTIRPKGRPSEGRRHKSFNNTQSSQLTTRIAEVSRSPEPRESHQYTTGTRMNSAADLNTSASPTNTISTSVNQFGAENVSFVVNDHIILDSDVEDLRLNRTLRKSVLGAMGSMMQAKFGDGLSGFVDTQTIKSATFHGLDKSLRCAQMHFNGVNHFFGSTWDTDQEEVVVLDSAAMDLTWQARYQLWLLYGQNEPEGQIRVRYDCVQRQTDGQNCGIFAIAFTYSVLFGIKLSTATFDPAALRAWILDCFGKRQLLDMPYRKLGRPAERARKTGFVFITSQDAQALAIRQALL